MAIVAENAYILAIRHRTLSQYSVYFYNASVVRVADKPPFLWGELEITDVNKHYWKEFNLRVVQLGTETNWFDTGSPKELFRAARVVGQRQQYTRILIGYPMGWMKRRLLPLWKKLVFGHCQT